MRWVWESRLEASVGSMSYIKHAVSWSNLPQKNNLDCPAVEVFQLLCLTFSEAGMPYRKHTQLQVV